MVLAGGLGQLEADMVRLLSWDNCHQMIAVLTSHCPHELDQDLFQPGPTRAATLASSTLAVATSL